MERHGARQKDARKSVWLPEMDRLLLVGMKHGPGGIRAARKALRQLAPKLTPGEIWKRMRRLREAGSNRHHDPSQWPAEIIQHLKDGYRAGGARKREALKSCREHYQSVPSYVISRFGHTAVAFGDGNLYSFLTASLYFAFGHQPMLLAVVLKVCADHPTRMSASPNRT